MNIFLDECQNFGAARLSRRGDQLIGVLFPEFPLLGADNENGLSNELYK